MTRSLLLIFMFLTIGLTLSAQTILRGTVTDTNGDPLSFASVTYEKGGNLAGVTTDLDGNYSVQLDPGTYLVTFSTLGYETRAVEGVLVKRGKATKLDMVLAEESIQIKTVVVKTTRYQAPLIDKEGQDGQTFTPEQIKKLPAKNISGIVNTVPGVNTIDGGGGVNVKGARANSTVYYLDDVRIRGTLPPTSEIEQLEVMIGGIEAKYGDTGGGIISVISKGPSRNFAANLEAETSEPFNPYGYNLVSVNASGPILSKKEDGIKKTILGFRVSGQGLLQKDDRPIILPVYVASDKSKAASQLHPTTMMNGSIISTGETYTSVGKEGDPDVDVWKMNYRPNEESKAIDLTAKLDAKITDNFQMTLSGTFNNTKDRFTPGGWRFMNSDNNPTFNSTRYRGIFRIRHRLGNWGAKNAEEASGIFKNMSYTILGSYEHRESGAADKNFGDELFKYGHVGQISFDRIPVFDIQDDSFPGAKQIAGPGGGLAWAGQAGYQKKFVGYTPSKYNPGLAAYNGDADAITSYQELQRVNGIAFNSATDNIWSALGAYKNANQVYNGYSFGNQNLYSIQANLSFDLHPKSKGDDSQAKKKGVHSINLGFQYEQRSDKNYAIAPQALWNIAGKVANSALQAVDPTNQVGSIDTIIFGSKETLPIYGAALDPNYADNKNFFKAIREKAGVDKSAYMNIDSLDPSFFTLDMFAGAELVDAHEGNSRVLDYYGYDYLGNPVDKTTTFKDFFSSKDANGNKNYPVAPAQPIFMGGYIQDKFIYEDMVFKLGVRVDRYDANTQVLKDKYSIYEIEGANAFYNNPDHPDRGTKPANIGDDYKVYLEGANSERVKAFRNGDQWYYANGSEAADGSLIFGGEVVYPAYVGGDYTRMTDENFDPSTSFKDYEPQWDISPRLSFSFPISDEANFFAHYDILSQRPTSNTVMTPLDYYNFFLDSGTKNNPDLKTQKAIDYAVGFQQKVSKTSSIKLTAFYQEMRNLIQSRTILYVPIVGRYTTYDNIDFSTTKGFTFEYDLRRTSNASLYLTYSLQFVNGTGSSANSARGLATRGLIRTTSPLSFDQRHTIAAIVDYRYKEKEGPRLFGSYIFQNAGANLSFRTYSGRPYTAKAIPTMFGGSVTKGALNGARKPWSFTVGLRVDKDFRLTKVDAKHPLFMNVYFRAENLLNTKNVINVYPATGSPTDDGYLATTLGQGRLESIRNAGQNVDSFLGYYKWALENPGNFVLPRRMYLGVIFDF